MATKSNRSSGTQHTARGANQGNVLVGPRSGLPIDEVVDENGVRRLAVDSNVEIDFENANINIDLDFNDDSVHLGDPSTGNTLKIESDGSINSNVAISANNNDSISISSHLNPIFDELAASLSTTNFEEIYSYTSISDDTRIISIEATAATNCVFRIKVNGSTIKSKRSSPLERNITFHFKEHRPLSSGDILTVEARVERFLSSFSPYETFTSLEGYLT